MVEIPCTPIDTCDEPDAEIVRNALTENFAGQPQYFVGLFMHCNDLSFINFLEISIRYPIFTLDLLKSVPHKKKPKRKCGSMMSDEVVPDLLEVGSACKKFLGTF